MVIGVATGSLLGFFIQYFPSSDQVKKNNNMWESHALKCHWKNILEHFPQSQCEGQDLENQPSFQTAYCSVSAVHEED